MRSVNFHYSAILFVFLWFVVLSTGPFVLAQSHSDLACRFIADANMVANPSLQPNSGKNRFHEISNGISIARPLPGRRPAGRAVLRNQSVVRQAESLTDSNAANHNGCFQTVLPPLVPPTLVLMPPADSNVGNPPYEPYCSTLGSNDESTGIMSLNGRQVSELIRPISGINLAEAAQMECLQGTELQQPQDQSYRFLPGGTAICDQLSGSKVHVPRRNLQPIWYNPLYFEDANLERCGQHHGVFTELVSVARFFGRMPILPYMMASNSPSSSVRSPGDCPTCSRFGWDAYVPQPNLHGTALQAAATVGLIFLIP